MIQRKRPSETLVFEYDFGPGLADQTIVAQVGEPLVVSRFGGALMTVNASAIIDKTVKVEWAGGVDGETYKTTVKVRDGADQIHEIDGEIEVREQPFGGLISVSEAKEHLRVDTDDEDYLIQGFIDAAIGSIDYPDTWLGRALTRQTITHRLDGFDCRPIRLPYPPHIAIVSVTYLDSAGVLQTVDPAHYSLDDRFLYAAPGFVWPVPLWNRRDAVKVTFTAGYDRLPPALRAAILLMVGDLYANRETTVSGVRAAAVEVPMSTTVANLLGPYRAWS